MMTDNRKQMHIMLLKLLHLGVTILIFYGAWLLYRYGALSGMSKYAFRYNYYVVAGYFVCVSFFNRTYNSYLLGYSRIRTLVFSQFLAQFFSAGIMWFIVSLAWKHWDAPWLFILTIFIQGVVDTFWSYFANGYYFKL